MKNEMVIFDNQVNKFGLRNLSIVERDLWWAIASKIKDRNGDVIELTRKEIVELSGYDTQNNTIDEFKRDMKSMVRKIMSLNTEIINENGDEVFFNLFHRFAFSPDMKRIRVEIHEDFQPWFNSLTKNFTMFELHKIVNLESKYTKELFRFLSQYKKTGYWTTSLDNFKELMCIPKSYKWYDIERQILKPAIKELVPDIFADLKITPTPEGRKIVGLEFKFMNVLKEKKQNKNEEKPYQERLREREEELKVKSKFIDECEDDYELTDAELAELDEIMNIK